MKGMILEPLKYYTSVLREKHNTNVSEHFDRLLATSRVNVEENRKTVKAYDTECENVRKTDKLIRKYRTFFGLLLALGIIGAVAAVLGIVFVGEELSLGLSLILGGAAAALVGFIVAFKVMRKKIRNAEDLRKKY